MAGIVPVILCGGSGTRLWPRSRAVKPKPFLPLVGDETLFEEALTRCADRTRFAAPLVVAGVDVRRPSTARESEPSCHGPRPLEHADQGGLSSETCSVLGHSAAAAGRSAMPSTSAP